MDCFFPPEHRAIAMVDLKFQDDQSDEMVPLCLHHIQWYRRDPTCISVQEILALGA